MQRTHTVHFTIADSIIIEEFAEEWEHNNHDGNKMALQHIDRKLKKDGVQAFDIQFTVKTKDYSDE
tara:strand:+ start:3289 stop:3486 length:198 start_codon:yes stop_codon:yes gene_type:complete